jgi:uncharacterized membrane protein
MSEPGRSWSDERIDQALGNLLRTGVLLAAAVVLVGGAYYLFRHGGEVADYGVFQGEPPELRHPSGILESALAWRGRGLIQLGLLLLIATPVARVAFSVFAFAVQRDRLYVVLTLIVLGVLVYSLFFAPA